MNNLSKHTLYISLIGIALILNTFNVLAYQQSEDVSPTTIILNEQQLSEIEQDNYQGRFFDFNINQPSRLLRFLIIVIITSIIVQFILLVWILTNRNKMSKIQTKTDDLLEKYQTLIIDHLFSENYYNFRELQQITTSKFNKNILINQMIDLRVNLSGEAKEKLRDLYLRLNLDKESISKAHSYKWHIKIKGFKELAFMNIKEANEEIKHALKSNHDILRMEAQLALVRLNEDDPYKFLDDLQKPFTLWEQLNVHELITYHNLPIPNFSRWTKSSNKSVAIFALRMINVFKQNHAAQAVIDSLEHSDQEIRHMAIKVCGEIQLHEALPHLKHIYKNENYPNCLAIIQAMGKMPDESVLGFLKLVIDKEEDVQLQIEAALAIAKMGETGISALVKLMKSEYKNYQIIIRHVLDKRIS